MFLALAVVGCGAPPPPTGVAVCAHNENGLLCARWQGQGFGRATLWTGDFSDGAGWAAAWRTLRMPDLDGDGFHDLCGRDESGLRCALRISETEFSPAFAAAPAFGSDAGFELSPVDGQMHFPDLNGDRLADACALTADAILCALGQGNGAFGPAKRWVEGGFADAASQLLFADLDGDKREDVCARTATGLRCARSSGDKFEAPTLWSAALGTGMALPNAPRYGTLTLVDVDGDKAADACGDTLTRIDCALSTRSSFAAPALWADLSAWMDFRSDTARFGDFNGDGRADLCLLDADGLYCALAQAGRFGPFKNWEGTAFHQNNGLGRRSVADTLTLLDLNGDHRSDVCARTDKGISCALSEGETMGSPSISVGELAPPRWGDRSDVDLVLLGGQARVSRRGTNRVAIENERPGATDWWVPYPQWSLHHEIEGFTDALSYPAGGTVNVKVSTKKDNQSVSWRLFRLGYYGGLGAREIGSGKFNGKSYPLPAAGDHTKPVKAKWPVAIQTQLPVDSVSGNYAFRLDNTVEKSSFFVTFTVREDNRLADLILQRSDFTDTLYNNWDGGLFHGSGYNGAVWLSLDRPMRSAFDQGDHWGYTAGLFVYEFALARWLEKLGYDVTYLSNWDVHTDPQALKRGRAFISAGHDEYWSAAMRDQVENSRNQGLPMAFFGSDDVDGLVRFSPDDPRAFSKTYSNVNLAKHEFASKPYNPNKPPHDNPQDVLTGTHFSDWCHVAHPHCETITGPGQPFARFSEADDYTLASMPHPALRALGGFSWKLPKSLGYEYEVIFAQAKKLPFEINVLASAPNVKVSGGPPVMVAYQHPSGARVFNSGSMHWSHGLDGWLGRAAFRLKGGERRCQATDTDCFQHLNPLIQQITANVLRDFGALPSTPTADIYWGPACDWKTPGPECLQ